MADGTLVDTNVLLDLVTNNADWADWSERQLEAAAVRGPVFINDVVYAEFSVGFLRIEEADAALGVARVEIAAMPRAALFLAGKAFQQYRGRGGGRTSVLPDFFIGAHAAIAKLPLLTRDARRYRTYFPTVTVIGPTG